MSITKHKDIAGHTRLKIRTAADTCRVRQSRAQGKKLILAGRKMRAWAKANDNEEAATKANHLTHIGTQVKDDDGDRELNLALAFLNGTPYKKCEEKCTRAGPPSIGYIAQKLYYVLPEKREVIDAHITAWVTGETAEEVLESLKPVEKPVTSHNARVQSPTLIQRVANVFSLGG